MRQVSVAAIFSQHDLRVLRLQAFEDGLTLQGENELTTPLSKELSATDNLSKPAAILSKRIETNVPCAQCLCAIRILPPTMFNTPILQ